MMTTTGPNYQLAAGLALGSSVLIGAVAHFAMRWHTLESAISAGVAGAVLFGVGLSRSFAEDARRMKAQALVRKNVEAAYDSQSLGRLDQAEKLLLEALDQSSLVGENDLPVLAATHSLGNLYRLRNKLDLAEQKYRRALTAYERLGKTDDLNYGYCLRDCALVLEARGQIDEALQLSKQAVVILEKHGEMRDVVGATAMLARKTRASGQFQEALEIYGRLKELQIQHLDPCCEEVVTTVLTLARCHRQMEQLPAAVNHYKDALVRINKAQRVPRALEAEALLELAEVRAAQGAPKDVEPLATLALGVMQNYSGPNEGMLQRVAVLLADAGAAQTTNLLQLFTQPRDQVRNALRDQPELTQVKDRGGWTLLHWTLFLGWDDITRWLLRNQGVTDSTDGSMNPVHVAAAWSKGSTIGVLSEAGLRLDRPGPRRWTPVHFAAYHGRVDCLEQLLAQGAPAESLDQLGRSALHWAAEQGHVEAVALLLSKGLKPDAADTKFGRSALHLAAAAGRGAVVRTLLMHGVDINLPDAEGTTALALAQAAGHKGLVTAMQHFHSA